jgi:drug/metabolite transporter (DMT)-like permease
MKLIVSKLLRPMGLERNQAAGLIDFFIGILMVVAPWFYVDDTNVNLLAIAFLTGACLILYAIFTDYRKGLIAGLARKIHDALDLTVGVTVMALFPVKISTMGLIISMLCMAGLGFALII